MHTAIPVLLAAKGITDHIAPADLMTRGGLDVVALMILVGLLYRRRPSAPVMPLVRKRGGIPAAGRQLSVRSLNAVIGTAGICRHCLTVSGVRPRWRAKRA